MVTKAIREMDLACTVSWSASYSEKWWSLSGSKITEFDFAQIRTLIFQAALVVVFNLKKVSQKEDFQNDIKFSCPS